MKVAFTRSELKVFNQGLNSIKGEFDIEFSYLISKNKNMIKSEIKLLEEEEEKNREEQIKLTAEYEREKFNLLKELSKDENGKPVIVNDQFDIRGNIEEANKEFKELNERYKKELGEQAKKREELNKFMKKEITVELHGISFEYAPKTMNQSQMDVIYPMIIRDEGRKSVKGKK